MDHSKNKTAHSSFIGVIKQINVKFNQALLVIAAISLLAIMLLVVFNSLLRTIYKPFPGTVELVSWLAAITTAFALGNTQLHKAHVYIDLLFNKFSTIWKKIVHVTMLCLSAVFFLIVAWQLILYGMNLNTTGVVSETMRVPFYPLIFFAVIGFIGLISTLLVQCIEIVIGEEDHES